MSDWIDYNMIVSEIGLHRSNAQFRAKQYKELRKERKLTETEEWLLGQAVGEETVLMCLEQWCKDFKFSSDDLKDFLELNQ